jgi:hypothetical protein
LVEITTEEAFGATTCGEEEVEAAISGGEIKKAEAGVGYDGRARIPTCVENTGGRLGCEKVSVVNGLVQRLKYNYMWYCSKPIQN